MLIGYVRVSTEQQDTEIQIEQLKAIGCEKIYTENKSGSSIENRTELLKAVESSRTGDTIVVMNLDRLARRTQDALTVADKLKEKEVGLRIEDLSIDVNSTTGRMVYTTLAAVAEMERLRIKERCDFGRAKAKKEGKHLGRPETVDKKKIKQLKVRGLKTGQIAEIMKVSRNTVYRALKQGS